MEIIPAIVPKNFWDLKGKLEQLEGLTEWVQLDITDGRFAPETTWSNTGDLAEIGGQIKFEIHLMVNKPEEVVADWLGVADRLIIHLESTDQLETILDSFAPHHNEIGVALLLDTPLAALKPYRGKIGTVQLMSIVQIGHQGELFDQRVLDRILELRSDQPEIRIQVDGGMNPDTIKLVTEAGADAAVVGSAIWESEDVAAAIMKLRAV
jgi:ribulose-phosphate 3-epimerase